MKKAFKKVNENFYIVDFPNKTKEVYFDIYSKSGYFDESEKEFGIGHLLEHYLIESIPNKEKLEFVNGSINSDFMNYYVKSDTKNAVRDIEILLKGILLPKFDNENLLKREKGVIENEILSKKDIKIDAFNFLLKQNFGDNFLYARDKKNQIANTKNVKLSDLKNHYEKVFNTKNVFFVLSGYELDKNTEKKISDLVNGHKLSKHNKGVVKVKISEFQKNKLIKNSKYYWNNELVFNLCFNLPIKIRKSHKDLKTLTMIRDYLEDQKFYFAKEMREIGVYSVSLDRMMWKNSGIIVLSAEIDREKIPMLKRGILNFLNNLEKDGISKSDILKLRKMQKDRLEKSFADNMKRLNWISNDLLFHTGITLLKDDLIELKEIDSNYIKKFSKQIFDIKKSNIVIFGKGSDKIKL
jgi:predicted Zn-dependent peptidase